MDNREFIVALDGLQKDYLSKLEGLAQIHRDSLGPQYQSAMEQILAEASAKIKSAAGYASDLQEHVVGRATKTLELIEAQAQRLAITSNHVLQTALEASTQVGKAEGQVTERLGRLVALADNRSQEMVRKVDINAGEAMSLLACREKEAEIRVRALRESAENAAHDIAQDLKRGVEAWGTMIRWVTAPVLVGIVLAAVVASGWAGRIYGESLGYDQARAIARENLKNDLAVSAYALKPEFNPSSGAITSLQAVPLDRPIVIVDGQPRWMSHNEHGWAYGGLRLRDNWAVAEAWDSKDKDARVLGKSIVAR